MIFDHRTYAVHPGTLNAYMEFYEKEGMATQKRHLGEPVLWAFTDVGEINTFVHVWAYEDAADRATKRAAMQADPSWQAYIKKAGELGYLLRQENKILVAAPFFEAKR